MSWISDIFAGGTAGVLQGAGSFAKDIREAITGKTITDPAVMAEIALKAEQLTLAADQARMDFEKTMRSLEAEVAKGQIAINQVEASSNSIFVAGWRPAVGWVCVLGLAYCFLFKPLFPWGMAILYNLAGHPPVVPVLPEVPMGDLMVLLGGMLGLGVLRTVDKYNRVSGPPGDKGNPG